MAYTVEQAKTQLDQLLQEAEEGKTVVIDREARPAIRLVVSEEQPKLQKRIPGRYAGQFEYPDEWHKPLETDEELRAFGFDILADAKVLDEPVK